MKAKGHFFSLADISFHVYTVLKNNYSKINSCFCSRYMFILSHYSDYSRNARNGGINASSEEILLPYMNLYIYFPNGNYFSSMHKIQFTYFLYCINFWGNKRVIKELIRKLEICQIHNDCCSVCIFNSDKILFSIL